MKVKERVDWTAVDAQIHGEGTSSPNTQVPSGKSSSSPPSKSCTSVRLSSAEKPLSTIPSHSLIRDPLDPCWSGYFTKEEIQEIQMHNALQLRELPEGLQAYLQLFANKHVLEDLVELHFRHRFHLSQVDECWAEKAIGEVLDLYYYSYNFFNKTQNDLLRRLWVFIEKCFDESVFEAVM
ncbi:hypothetical protein BDB00DRAFT_789932 [Zychaea mexicana]|uniref:uncharacterized protein n=1 Tax=Zychaea mexicana TaxID=64656 RepID=UPI0022FE328A|nr:uncharacterized protein BDB00DRAFT_791642 [Zychaea mexicana]XP_052977116.1 uncharacterized protein BDB00DRAFT_789932 [Zychaea mexicana]KAI9488778.1 hypothetical protein BDB00DRAFT_791642 [Zychaea mexicana]KAI9490851.1 hypothetical protein BDB00DRAFT_789932 [Zychaea mexicana]